MKKSGNSIIESSLGLTRGRRFFWVLGGITLLGLLLRVLVSWQLYQSPSVQNPVVETDMATYRRLALAVCQGNWPAFFDYQPFYYTIFLPVLYLFAPSGSPFPVVAAQILLGTASIWLCGITAAKLFGRRAGCLAALLLASSQFHIFYTPYLLLEVLQSFWMALILYWTIRVSRSNAIWDWSLLALFCAFSTLTRGNALLFVPGILLLCCWKNVRRPWRAAALAGLIVLFFYLPQLPYSWRNYQHFGRWRGPSVAQDKVLALGNTPEAPPGGLEYPRSYHEWCRQADDPDAARRESVSRKMLKRLQTEPLLYLEQKFRTLLLFWDKMEIPNNISVEDAKRYSSLLRSPLLFRFSLLGSLGLAGLLLCFPRLNAGRSCLVYGILAYGAGTVAFYMLARFRIGCLPLLCVAGGGGVRLLLTGLGQSGQDFRMRLQRRLLLLLLAVFLVNSAYSHYHQFLEPAILRRFQPDGMVLDFPGSLVFYDHGPLFVGGTVLMPIEEEVLVVEKELVIPDRLRSRVQDQEGLVWLRILTEAPSKFTFDLEHATQKIRWSDLTKDRMNTWVRFRIPAVQIEDGKVRLRFLLKKNSGNCWVAFDQSRKYGRTMIKEPGQELQQVPMELFAELEIPAK